ncbi:ubiquitin-conjugating enzyme E2 [Pseudoalteromonas sp. B137]
MTAFSERINQDIRKINELSDSIGGRISIKKQSGTPVNSMVIEIDYPTAPSKDYPNQVQKKTEVHIKLLSRYPFQEPEATITTPIFHPNVYQSGKICFGTKWLPSQGLDLLIKRIIQIITFDETILNEGSPANGAALRWYKEAVLKYSNSFPTDKLVIKEKAASKMSWNNVDISRVIVNCSSCQTGLRVPMGKKGNLTCPNCSTKFYVET